MHRDRFRAVNQTYEQLIDLIKGMTNLLYELDAPADQATLADDVLKLMDDEYVQSIKHDDYIDDVL